MPDATDDDLNENLVTITPEQEEVNKGVEENNLLDVDARRFINIISSDIAAVYWRPKFCTTCSKPMVMHSPLQQNRCQRLILTQVERTRYEKACKNNETMAMATEIITAAAREEKAAQQRPLPWQAPNMTTGRNSRSGARRNPGRRTK